MYHLSIHATCSAYLILSEMITPIIFAKSTNYYTRHNVFIIVLLLPLSLIQISLSPCSHTAPVYVMKSFCFVCFKIGFFMWGYWQVLKKILNYTVFLTRVFNPWSLRNEPIRPTSKMNYAPLFYATVFRLESYFYFSNKTQMLHFISTLGVQVFIFSFYLHQYYVRNDFFLSLSSPFILYRPLFSHLFFLSGVSLP